MKNKKSKSQKSRRREPATNPSAVPSEEVTQGFLPPSKCPSAENRELLLARVEEFYRTHREREVAALRFKGIHDPEAAFHDAVLSVLKTGSCSPKAIDYLMRRLKSRTYTVMEKHYNRQKRVQDVPDEFWPNLPANDDDSTDAVNAQLGYLFEHLDDQKAQVLRWHHLDAYPIARISMLTGKSISAIKTDLFRTRQEAREIIIRFWAIHQ
jgi:DNA-directed RNA polymerase specialized sigma24 family protein